MELLLTRSLLLHSSLCQTLVSCLRLLSSSYFGLFLPSQIDAGAVPLSLSLSLFAGLPAARQAVSEGRYESVVSAQEDRVQCALIPSVRRENHFLRARVRYSGRSSALVQSGALVLYFWLLTRTSVVMFL